MARPPPHLSQDAYGIPTYVTRDDYTQAYPSYEVMYASKQPIDPVLTKSSSHWHQRRPNLTLDKSTAWAYHSQHPLPTPPMSNSPTSPRRASRLSDTSASFEGLHTTTTSLQPPLHTPVGLQHLPAPQAYSQASLPPPPQPPMHAYYQHVPFQGQFGDPRLMQQGRQTGYMPALPQMQQSQAQAQTYADVYHQQPYLPAPAPLASQHGMMPLPSPGYGPTSAAEPSSHGLQRQQRRQKAHVAKACANCKKAHLACDEARPCARCVTGGKENTCQDVEHKKRGRPRIRDTANAISEQGNVPMPFASSIGSLSQALHGRNPSIDRPGLARTQSLRQPVRSAGPQLPSSSGRRPGQVSDVFYPPRSDSSAGPALLIAYLSLDMRILRANDAFRDAFLNGGEPRALLHDLLVQRDQLALTRVQTALREERTIREPHVLPPLNPEQQEREAVDRANDAEIESYSHGFDEKSAEWTWALPNGTSETMITRIKLARTTAFFVILTLRRIAQPALRRNRPQSMDASALIAQAPYPLSRTLQQTPYPPYELSAPPSPLSNFAAMGTSLPPDAASVSAGYMAGQYARSSVAGPSVSAATMQRPSLHSSLSYTQGMPMAAPSQLPQPPQIMPSASGSAQDDRRERRRPDPLGPLQLPPIVSSAPTTPRDAPAMGYGPVPGQQSGGVLQTPEQARSGDSSNEDSTRKRRRMDIGDIVG